MCVIEGMCVCVRQTVWQCDVCVSLQHNGTKGKWRSFCFSALSPFTSVAQFSVIPNANTEPLFRGIFFILWKEAQRKSYTDSSLTFHPESSFYLAGARLRETWWPARSVSRAAIVLHSVWATKDKATVWLLTSNVNMHTYLSCRSLVNSKGIKSTWTWK